MKGIVDGEKEKRRKGEKKYKSKGVTEEGVKGSKRGRLRR